ncbi:MAG: winged-helix domain-containing protein [Gemmatimonadota bacterium]|nr:winged-helix domain-containing protein [Gemmatimonadota bacterium]
MSRKRKPSKPPASVPTVLVLGRVRTRVNALVRALERYGIVTRSLGWKASSSGLWRLGAQTPHAVVVDLPAPVTAHHVEVIQRLRDRWEQVPQIVVVPNASPSVLTSLLAVGVDDFVASDEAWAELIVRLRRQLRRVSPHAMPATVDPDRMRLDPARRTVSANGRSIALTTREFDVFACLVECGGTTLTREEILRRVWGDAKDRPSTPGIVGVYVLYVRRKLTKLGLAHALLTVKGRGYSFQAPTDYWAPPPLAALGRRGARADDLHPAAPTRRRRASDDDLDVTAEAKQNPNKAVRRKAL